VQAKTNGIKKESMLFKKPLSFYHRVIFIFFLSVSTQKTVAQPSPTQLHPMKEVYQQVLAQLKQKADQKVFNARIEVRELSDRLQLPRCKTPVTIEDKSPEKFFGRMTFEANCEEPAWKIYITAFVEGDLPAVITTKAILDQAVITKEDIKLVYLPYKSVRKGTLVQVESAVGMRAKRGIAPNTLLTVRQLQPPYLVFKGNRVKIVTKIGSIQVRSIGTALESGTLNQQITVKNLSSKKEIKGTVIAPNTVSVY